MARKVCQIGPSTLMVSLPSRWVKQQRIKKGDELEVREEANSLIIAPRPIASTQIQQPITLDVSVIRHRGTIWRFFMTAYRAGFSEIIIRFNPEDTPIIQEIRRMVSAFIGMEIMDQTPASFTVREIAAVKAEEFDQMLKKTFLSLIQTGRDIVTAINQQDRAALTTIYEQYDEKINRFTDYGIKIINRERHNFRDDAHYRMLAFTTLEKIGDCWMAIVKQLLQKAVTPMRIHAPQLNALVKMLESAYDAYHSHTTEKAIAVLAKRNELHNQLLAAAQEKGKAGVAAASVQLLDFLADIMMHRMTAAMEQHPSVHPADETNPRTANAPEGMQSQVR